MARGAVVAAIREVGRYHRLLDDAVLSGRADRWSMEVMFSCCGR